MNSFKSFSRLAAIVLCLGAGAAYADTNPWLPVQNANFATDAGSPSGIYFTSVAPVGWTQSFGGPLYGSRVYLNPQADLTGASVQPVYAIAPSPVPGFYLQSDGAGVTVTTISQTLTGLTPGQTYQLSFYEASGQAVPYTGNTNNEWVVSLGTSALTVGYGNGGKIGPGNDTLSASDPSTSIAVSTLMNNPSQGSTPWQLVSLDLTADATTDVLSFLAWGDGGSTANLPPIAFLAGINSNEPPPPSVSEPSALALFGLGLLGVGGSSLLRGRRSRRGSVSAA